MMIDYSSIKIELTIKRGKSIEFYDKHSGNVFTLLKVEPCGDYSSEFLDVRLLPSLPLIDMRRLLLRAIYTDDIVRYRKQHLAKRNRFDYSFGGVAYGGSSGSHDIIVSRSELDRCIYKIA